MPACIQCTKNFDHTSSDLAFYQSLDLPTPVLCPDCRHQQRIAYRNERTLYPGICAACNKQIVTHFSGDQPFPLYCPDCWWGDSWNGLEYGTAFDFSRPFFEQFHELQQKIPRPSLNNSHAENAEYCNQCVRNKNSYLLFAADDNEDCMYSYWINRCVDTLNSSNLADCTLCIDCIDSENCYHCIYSQDLKSCNECYFSFNLIGCNHCFGSAGLRNKEYCFQNKQCTKEEYNDKLATLNLQKYEAYRDAILLFHDARSSIPHKFAHITNSENCTGDYIINSKQSEKCFDVFDAEECSYCYNLVHRHYNNRDISFATEARNIYQCQSVVGEEMYFGMLTWFCSNVWYSDLVMTSHNMFGCVGLKHQNYCILNQHYTPEEFATLRKRIIEHMKKTGEWGQYFPIEHSPFCYNETIAQDFFPLSKEEVVARGWRWKPADNKQFKEQTYVIPDDISDVKDSICNEILSCTRCKRNYKILPYELQIYKNYSQPIPRTCHECRFRERLMLRNPRTLFPRFCATCNKPITSTYAPERPERILCEACYLKSVY